MELRLSKEEELTEIIILYDLVKKRSFPSLQIGKRYVIIVEEADEWFKHKTKNPFNK